jgi:hypothetical protein
MEQIKGHLEDKLTYLKNKFSEELKIHPGINSDHHLTRFLIARDYDLKKTEKMISDYFLFRVKYNFDKIMESDFEEYYNQNKKYLNFYTLSKNGNPVLINKCVNTIFLKMLQEYGLQKTIENFIIVMELNKNIALPICCEILKRKIEDGVIFIIDLKGNEFSTFMDKEYQKGFKTLLEVCQDTYPEMLCKVIIINAPKLFSTFWSIMKFWMTKRTRDKITVSHKSEEKLLKELIDEEYLPDFLGGKAQDKLEDTPGPWKKYLEDALRRKSLHLNDKSIVKYWYGE